MDGWVFNRSVAVALLCFFIGVGGGGGLSLAIGAQEGPFWTESQPQPVPNIQAPNFAQLAERLKPAVVNISTTQTVKREPSGFRGSPFPQPFGERGERDPFQEFFERFFGGNAPQREFRRSSLGSGFIIAKDGYIVTNSHVVENASDIKVSLSDKDSFAAKVIGRDPKTDVALIKIEADRDLPVAPLGDSDRLQVGEWVIAIGNPFALGHTVTAGIASAKGRIIGAGPYDDFIQTDASINPGNSGGPLFNLNGEVVGVNTAIVATGQGIGFAIPINLVKEVLPQLRETGKVTRGWLGVQVQEVTPELAQSFGLERPHGALVAEVQPNSPAEHAGIQRGDIIVTFGGEQIADVHALPRLVATTPPGTEAKVQVIRNGQERTVQVKVHEMPGEPRQAALEGGTVEQGLGLTVQDLTPELARRLEMPSPQGVVVTAVADGSPADEVGIRRGDVILEANQQQIKNVQDYRTAVQRAGGAHPVLFLIRREGNAMYVAVRPEE